jgi:uncharacterized membrane-anchored protein
LIAAAIAIFALANHSILVKEALLAEGRVVLLELAPVDPRSLMQGDYMDLRFKAADEAFGRLSREAAKEIADGCVVVRTDARGVGHYVRRDDGKRLTPDEVRMRYRVRGGQVKFATNAFFFQEGHAKYYERARYGEFRVAADGELLLTAMLGERLERLGQSASRR